MMLRGLQAMMLFIAATCLPAAEKSTVETVIDLGSTSFAGGVAGEDGIAFRFDLGQKRTNWNKAAWSQWVLRTPRDLRAFAGLRLSVQTADQRRDAEVAIALQEADGSWHYMADAVELTRAENEATVAFADFRPAVWIAPHVLGAPLDHLDENQNLDLDAVARIAIGVANPYGVGQVAFSLTGLELIPASQRESVPARITVSGRLQEVNGTRYIPKGMFGFFVKTKPMGYRVGSYRCIGGSLTPGQSYPPYAQQIDCEGGDRYQPSTRMTRGNWQQSNRAHGQRTGRNHAQIEAEQPVECIVEYYNEPYLNWANRTRAGLRTELFDVSRAREGGPVHRKVDGGFAPHLRWTQDPTVPPWLWKSTAEWRGGKDEKGRVVRGAHPPANVADGETFTAPAYVTVTDPSNGKKKKQRTDDQTLTAFTPWYVYDETQFTFWSGKGQLPAYNDPMLAFARGLHETNPKAKLIVGWDMRPGEDGWAAFRQLYRPTIDAAIGHIHGITDHDYGGDVTRMPANAEVIAAYGMGYYDKWLYSYNTECGENSDPSAHPAAQASLREAGKKWLKTMWSSRKIVHALALTPDKMRSTAWCWFDDGAEGVTFRCLRNLRGQLVATSSSDPLLYAVTAIDGMDPTCPRPDDLPGVYELVVAVFNDHGHDRQVEITVQAPAGCKLLGGSLRRPVADADGGSVTIVEETLAGVAGGSFTWQGQLPAKSLQVLSFQLGGVPVDAITVRRQQYFADRVMVNATTVLDTKGKRRRTGGEVVITVPKEDLAKASSGYMRCVFEQLAPGEGTVLVNGQAVALPACPTPRNVAWIRDVPLSLAHLQERNELQFIVDEADHAGYLVAMASIVLEYDQQESSTEQP